MKRRSGMNIMGQLIGLVRPLLHVMLAAILLGVAGYLCAIFLTVMAGAGILKLAGLMDGFSLKVLFLLLGAAAILRGILHYGEQACNHYIAFKLLALIRHKVFAALRRLCPAKLDGKDKGNLISILTTDIELLEVFYAHTISPIAIAVVTCLIVEVFSSITASRRDSLLFADMPPLASSFLYGIPGKGPEPEWIFEMSSVS